MARGKSGAIAQLGERLLCKQEVAGSIPAGSTNLVSRLYGAQPHMHRVRCMCGFVRAPRELDAFFKNSEVVLTHQIQAKC